MKTEILLNQIRPIWLQRVSHDLGGWTGSRGAFVEQLEHYYDALEQATLTGNPAWLDAILTEWTSAPTLTELKEKSNNVSDLLHKMIALTTDVIMENLSSQQSLFLLTTITPFHIYALEKTAHLEMEVHTNFISKELMETQQKLERLDRSKSNFVSVAAHELKTPLTLIEGYTAMMRDQLTDKNDAQIETLFEGVNTGIQRLRQIIDDMIDVSLIDNNLLSLNFQPIWLKQILMLLSEELQPVVRERQQTLLIKQFEGSETWIYADGERLYQALRNVLINAVKFTPDQGKITVDGRSLPGFIELTVTDTGIGISPENQTLIFEKFGQLGRANLHSSGKIKFKGGGPGLGLSITRGIIEAHGGTIWVESEGHDERKCPGSTFHILLPARTESMDPKVAKLFGKLEKTPSDGKENTPANPASA